MGVHGSRARSVVFSIALLMMFFGIMGFVNGADGPRIFGVFLLLLSPLVAMYVRGFQSAHQQAEIERDRRISVLKELAAGVSAKESRAAIALYRRKKESLMLTDSEIATEDAVVEGIEAIVSLREAIETNGGKIPTLTGHERAIGEADCYLAVEAFHDKRGENDEKGTLYVTSKSLVFLGSSIVDVPWTKIARLSHEGMIFSALRRDRQNPLVFCCYSIADVVRVAYLAERCVNAAVTE